jgi:DNA-binding LacI/PurR family transcriptional regulator
VSEQESKPPTARTLKDLAVALGVSRTTISNAFNRPNQLSAELRDRILNSALELGYPGPHALARKLRTGRAGAIGVLFGDTLPYAFTDAAAIAFLRGVAQVCERHHAGMLILPAVDEPAAGRMVREAAVDGFITHCLPDGSTILPWVLERQLPVVVVEQSKIPGVLSVGIDDLSGARAAARHLLDLGHRHFAILSLDLRPDGHRGLVSRARLGRIDYPGTARRLGGYQAILREAGIDLNRVPVMECSGNDRHLAREATLELLESSDSPTALLAMSDELAHGALQAARQLGVAVPERLSVVGFDDAPGAEHLQPPLTTVRQPLTEKGRVAARLLLQSAKVSADIEDYLLRTELIIRGSTAVAPNLSDTRRR